MVANSGSDINMRTVTLTRKDMGCASTGSWRIYIIWSGRSSDFPNRAEKPDPSYGNIRKVLGDNLSYEVEYDALEPWDSSLQAVGILQNRPRAHESARVLRGKNGRQCAITTEWSQPRTGSENLL